MMRSVVPPPKSLRSGLALAKVPNKTMFASLTSPVNVSPCMVQNGQAKANAEGIAHAVKASTTPKRRRVEKLSMDRFLRRTKSDSGAEPARTPTDWYYEPESGSGTR